MPMQNGWLVEEMQAVEDFVKKKYRRQRIFSFPFGCIPRTVFATTTSTSPICLIASHMLVSTINQHSCNTGFITKNS